MSLTAIGTLTYALHNTDNKNGGTGTYDRATGEFQHLPTENYLVRIQWDLVVFRDLNLLKT